MKNLIYGCNIIFPPASIQSFRDIVIICFILAENNLGGLNMLTQIEAERELKLAAQLNPGPWEQHSISVAQNM